MVWEVGGSCRAILPLTLRRKSSRTEEDSGHPVTFQWESFATIVNNEMPLTIAAKWSIIGVCASTEHVSDGSTLFSAKRKSKCTSKEINKNSSRMARLVFQDFSSELVFIEILILFELVYLKISLENTANTSLHPSDRRKTNQEKTYNIFGQSGLLHKA